MTNYEIAQASDEVRKEAKCQACLSIGQGKNYCDICICKKRVCGVDCEYNNSCKTILQGGY